MTKRAPSVVRRPLSRHAILSAALNLVDREGLDALSMRRLGKELGVEAMSLYNHVPSKAALLDGLIEHALADLKPDDPTKEWPDRVRDMAHAYRAMANAHPHMVSLIATRPFNTATALEPLERALGVFRSAGFDEAASIHAFRTIAGFATGYTLAETQGFFGEHAPADTSDVLNVQDLDPERFPNLLELLPTIAACDHGEEFDFALDVMIEGLRTKLR